MKISAEWFVTRWRLNHKKNLYFNWLNTILPLWLKGHRYLHWTKNDFFSNYWKIFTSIKSVCLWTPYRRARCIVYRFPNVWDFRGKPRFFDEARGVFIRQLNACAICIFILRGRDNLNRTEVRSVKMTTKRYKFDEFKSR